MFCSLFSLIIKVPLNTIGLSLLFSSRLVNTECYKKYGQTSGVVKNIYARSPPSNLVHGFLANNKAFTMPEVGFFSRVYLPRLFSISKTEQTNEKQVFFQNVSDKVWIIERTDACSKKSQFRNVLGSNRIAVNHVYLSRVILKGYWWINKFQKTSNIIFSFALISLQRL